MVEPGFQALVARWRRKAVANTRKERKVVALPPAPLYSEYDCDLYSDGLHVKRLFLADAGEDEGQALLEIIRFDQTSRRSRAVVHNGTIYLAGQVADDKQADIVEQTRQALAKVDDLLAEAGTDKSRLLSAVVWLKSMQDFDAMNSVWDRWVAPGHAPARSCSQAELAHPDYRVEITGIASR